MITLVHNGVETTHETDKDLLDYMMEEKSDIIPPEVYDSIKDGHTYDNEVARWTDEGMDPWDGVSLVRWIGQGGDVDIHTK